MAFSYFYFIIGSEFMFDSPVLLFVSPTSDSLLFFKLLHSSESY